MDNTLPCPVCNNQAVFFDIADFNKSCEERRGVALQPTGVMIQYFRCLGCGFCFAPEFEQWTLEDFSTHIYNEDYVAVDPDYLSMRPHDNADLLSRNFGKNKARIRHLDYGGGNGMMSELLQAEGWNSKSYDPFNDPDMQISSLGKFNCITAFEVFEHVPDVSVLMQNLNTLLEDKGGILFSTLLSDGELDDGTLGWWYAAPRNGHISLFSAQSLKWLGQRYGLQLRSLTNGTHLFYRDVLPDWLS